MNAIDDTRPQDAAQFLTTQHREVEQLWAQVEASHGAGSDEQVGAAREIVRMLSQHDALETQLLYPELRDKAGERGQELSDASLSDHHEVRALLSEVDRGDIRDQAVFDALARCMATVQEHVAVEEGEVFPLLQQACGEERLIELGEQMAAMMGSAPTHPHTSMPDSKAGATVMGTVAGLADKARDALDPDN